MNVSAKGFGVVAVLTAGMAMVALARMSPQVAAEETISGTLTETRIITRDARLTGDVICAMTGAPYLRFGGVA